jgi:hypothetical protein
MPKRIATPPPADDEPKYLTVVKPYPLNAHWELPKDVVEFARWIACCIGTTSFYAFFYKPKAWGLVILEIERKFDGFERLLGEHRWSEFLLAPSAEEKDRVSQVFYCLHKSGREVQKDGWKRINVEEAWFKDWSPINQLIKFPYPTTHYCAVPSEDKTNKSLCRPLPALSFPKPPRVAPPVVGSEGWVSSKGATSKAPPNAWGSTGSRVHIDKAPKQTPATNSNRGSPF